MSFLPLAFGFPAMLWGLLALPVIWWLLRLTPPKPQSEIFPPLRILAQVLRREETPQRSPWWLTLLRLALAALVVLALAGPVFNPRDRVTTASAGLALLVDNGWSSAPDWERRAATAERLIDDAATAGAPVLLAFTAEKANADIGPFDAEAARGKLRATEPRPIPTDRPAVFARVAESLKAMPGATVAMLTDGLAGSDDEQAFETLFAGQTGRVVWATPGDLPALGLTSTENAIDGFSLTVVRAPGDAAPRNVTAGAFDDKGRRIADASLSFAAGETSATGLLKVPFELRNDFSSIALDGQPQAAAVRLLDDNAKRRRIGLLSQAEADQAQPLLSPLYYIRNALQPFADLIDGSEPDLVVAIPALIAKNPAMIVMADVGTIPDGPRAQLVEWVEGGGTLIRFAGSRLAASGIDDDLLPVRLRGGERALGGTLSWTEPQPVAPFPATGPFADLAAPSGVSVTRQVLAEPSADIAERTWASLADGTPLVTGARRGKGTLILFHVTPEATWSNLPISGTFVEMLRRVVQLSRNQGDAGAGSTSATAGALAPFRMIAANGGIVPPPPDARPLISTPGAQPPVTLENPPGLYGTEEGVVAHNLLPADATLEPIVRPSLTVPVEQIGYAFDQSRDLKGWLMALALCLLLIDSLAVLWMGGAFARRPRRAGRAAVGTAAAVLVALGLAMVGPSPTHAQESDARPGDDKAIEAVSTTHLAYVVTGESSVDAISRAGLTGLTRFLIEKTALEPGDPVGVDIASDELAFYPILYWPVDPGAAMPTQAAIARVDAYMQQGGTVLFDTRDQYATGIGDNDASPATQRLRAILANLNVPPLEPVPADHVLTKSFFILPEFPGRFSGGPLWVEASLDAQNTDSRPVRTGDGVSPIMITANDFAGAWAIDENGEFALPTVPSDPMQRAYALRAGVNIVMYMLTGNYKSDQVHVPVLLERLGQ